MVQMRIKSLHASPDGAKLMKPKIDLVSRFLVNANGQSPVPVIKKRKTREGFTGMRPPENTLMLKSDYEFSK